MIRAIVFDFSRVFLFPKNEGYTGELNALHQVLSENPNYKFSENFIFNYDLLEYIKNGSLEKKFRLFMFTSGIIQETPECREFLSGIFEKIVSAQRTGLTKNESSSYFKLASTLGFQPDNILFVDDLRENTEAAELAGFQTITFRNNMQFETEIGGYINSN